MNKLEILKENIFYQINILLKEIGEFSPFGVKMEGEEIKSVNYYYEDEKDEIDSSLVIKVLTENISKELLDSKIEIGAIAYNVSINNYMHKGKVFDKLDALCIKYTFDGSNWDEDYYPYRFNGEEYVWGLD